MSRSTLLALGLLVCLSGCSEQSDPPPEPASRVRPEPVVVYADQPREAVLREVFAGFTNATGIPVTIREASGEKNLDDVLSNKGAPPADVLFADNIADIWLAGDEGALRQLAPDSGIKEIPDALRDPDGQWLTMGIDELVIVTGQGVDSSGVLGYDDLGEERFKEALCLPVSAHPESRALIALYIEASGERPAERIARRWMANLARPPMHSSKELLEALDDGSCGISIVPAASLGTRSDLEVIVPKRPAVVAFGAGVARHARYPETAAELLAWLASVEGQEAFAEATGTLSVLAVGTPRVQPFSTTGWLDEEARLLAERASWR